MLLAIGQSVLEMIDDNICSCPGDVLIYECTVVGGLSTVWKGSALYECCKQEIGFLHSTFNDSCCNSGVNKSCHCFDRDIVVKIVKTHKNNSNVYTSQLKINGSLRTAGDIECLMDNGTQEQLIGRKTIPSGMDMTTKTYNYV